MLAGVYRFGLCASAAAVLLAAVVGCQDGWQEAWGRKKELPPEPPPELAPRQDPAFADTIGAYALLGSAQDQYVRGFGLVIGLGDAGSSDCPTTVREYLIEYLAKQRDARQLPGARRQASPAALIDARDTAVVEIIGEVGAGTARGTTFDVRVQAIAGTETRSLEGGLLLPCELRVLDPMAAGKNMVSGTVIARAFGPVFTNPLATDSSDRMRPLSGEVLGGGYTTVGRPFRLVLTEPSYSLARRIEQRINERFGQTPPTAEAVSEAYLTVNTPPAFALHPRRFTELATHLYLPRHSSFVERELRELRTRVARPGAPLERIALVWEALGRVVLPSIQPLYADADPAVRYYAARTGLRLNDVTALPVVSATAETPGDSRRIDAIRELADTDSPRAVLRLSPLLDDSDPAVRVAAYEALLHRHPAIQTYEFPFSLPGGHVNLYLDVIESRGVPMIYARTAGEPRIAVFGPRTPLHLPVFYNHPQDRVTVNADVDAADLTVLGRTRYGGRLTRPMFVPPLVIDLIAALADLPVENDSGRLRGLGLSYSQVVQVLAALSLDGDGTIPARLVLETGGATVTPPATRERPESDAAARWESDDANPVEASARAEP